MFVLANIKIKIVVKSTLRLNEAYLPSRSWTQPFQYVTTTNLGQYTQDTLRYADEVYNYSQAQLAIGATNTIYIAINIDNVTAPPVAAGVVGMPKTHIDFALSSDELTSSQALQQTLITYITDQVSRAEYN